jgi:diguanylate cyclase (GGDEF)-like protein
MWQRQCRVLIWLMFLWVSSSRAADPTLSRLTPDLDVFPQFFSFALDAERNLYVGATQGVLRYDGGRWAQLKLGSTCTVRALHTDVNGRVWVGGTNNFGYIDTAPNGEMHFVDLAPQFKDDLRGALFADVWRIAEFDGAIYFGALRHLFKVNLDGQRAHYWQHPGRFGAMANVHGALWLQWRGEGIRQLVGNDFLPIAGTELLAKHLVVDLFALADGSALVHSSSAEFAIWREGKLQPISATQWGDQESRLRHLYKGIVLGNSQIAFAGDDGVLRVLDFPTKKFTDVPIGRGFISDAQQDQDGSLLALDDAGVVRLEWPSRWLQYGAADGVDGSVNKMQLMGNTLIVTTDSGVLQTTLEDGELKLPFQALPWTNDEAWQVLADDGDSLLLAESRAVVRVRANQRTMLTTDDLYPRVMLRDSLSPDRLWVGTEHGPVLFSQTANGYQERGRVEDVAWRVYGLVAAPGGVWMTSDDRGLSLAKLDGSNPRGFTTEPWAQNKGLQFVSERAVDVFQLPEGLFASTDAGLFRLAGDNFVADSYFGLGELLKPLETVELFAADNGDRWAFSFHSIYYRHRDNVWRMVLRARPGDGAFSSLVCLPGGDVLIGGTGIIRRYRVHAGNALASPVRARITAVRETSSDRRMQLRPLNQRLQLTAHHGSVEFDVGLADLRSGEDKQFQVRLEGASTDWSDWSTQRRFSYLSLAAGDYVFRFRGRGADGTVTTGESFELHIVPRWFEHTLVLPLAIFALGALLLSFLMFRQRRRVHVLRNRNLALDQMVKQRTYDLELINLSLRDAADRDGLTGISNRRHFDRFLLESVASARARQSCLGLALMDVDHFKQFNDANGHQAGDEMLRQVATCLSSNVRGDTLAARYGGEEFAIVAPDCNAQKLRELAERLRTCIEDSLSGVTVSIGLASLEPGAAGDADSLVAAADAALYKAKQSGRNQVVEEGGADKPK